MEIRKVTALYFSPTGGTAAYAEAVASALAAEHETVDLTGPEAREKEYRFGGDELVIIGAPVYAGRLPPVKGLLTNLHGCRTPAVYLVSYGNRAFDDALLEEKELCDARGFIGIAASAWIAPHTFSAKIGAGRPDEADRAKIRAFAEKVRDILRGELREASVSVPGGHPCCPVKRMPFHPEGSEACVRCGRCAAVCPVRAISRSAPEKTDAEKCIDCLACVRACPVRARNVYRSARDARPISSCREKNRNFSSDTGIKKSRPKGRPFIFTLRAPIFSCGRSNRRERR